MNFEPLLKPRSIAILGASERPSIGRSLAGSLDNLGFAGEVYPINPKYDELYGRACYGSLAELPGAPDAVVFCTGRERTQELFRQLPDSGARAAVIYGGGYAELGEEGRALQHELSGICREAGIALMGPNCMGGISPWHPSSTYMSFLKKLTGLQGNVGLVSQSGSVSLGMLTELRRFGFSHIVSSGNEAAVCAVDYMEYLIGDPRTRVIALFLEAVNAPERFVAALDRAADAGKPVVVLKVGRSERAQRSIVSHTGGLAGRSEVFSAVLRAHRAIEVRDLEEMTEVIAVCQGDAWPKGPRVAVITASGGHAELILDTAEETGAELPRLSEKVRTEVEAVTGRLTGDGNPADAWSGGDFKGNVVHASKVFAASGDYDAVGVCIDAGEWDPFEHQFVQEVAGLVIEGGAGSETPHFMLSTSSGGFEARVCDIIRKGSQATLHGIRPSLFALAAMGRWSRFARRTRNSGKHSSPGLEGARQVYNEYDAKRLLKAAGLPTVDEVAVSGVKSAREAAATMGYPVVLKAFGDAIPHKTELGLVEIGINDAAELEAAWSLLEERRAGLPDPGEVEGLLVQPMVQGGVELFAGVSRDPQFGLTMAFGLGGTAIEVMADFTLRMLPLAEGEAEEMIAGIRGAALLGPVRGGPASDTKALAACLYALSDFAMAHERQLREIDLNPIKVGSEGEGCCILDALIVTGNEEACHE